MQVVLGEGEPGILRLVLEAQGFDVVGHARGDEELREVVAVTHPSVIVLDAGISAVAMREAQIRSDYAPIVAVWPKDTVPSVAEERVDPALAVLELGNAVRRVVARHAESERVPNLEPAVDPGAADETADLQSSLRRRPSGRARHALVLVAAWTISLTALTAIGLAVPSALRALRPAARHHVSIHRPEGGLTSDRERTARGAARTIGGSSSPGPSCAASANGASYHRSKSAKTDQSGRGCALGHAKHGVPGERGEGHGRPDDPGKGSGRGHHHGGRPDGSGSGHRGGDHGKGARPHGGGDGSDGNGGEGSNGNGNG